MTNGDKIRSMTDEELAKFIFENLGNWWSIICTKRFEDVNLEKWVSSEYEEKKN